MKTLSINLTGTEREYNLLRDYKGFKIVSSKECPDCIEVYNPKENTLFIVALDDSKQSGRRVFVDSANNIQSAMEYIDWKQK